MPVEFITSSNMLYTATHVQYYRGVYRRQYSWSGKMSMHDDMIDLWAWHCICNGIATPELARALAQVTGHYRPSNSTTAKYNYRPGICMCSVCH